MSDFLYYNKKQKKGILTELIRSIYPIDNPDVFEFHGKWGSIAISKNLYYGFDPIETDEYVCFVIGGPVLTFTKNDFLTGNSSAEGTKRILKRILKEDIEWDKDFSGPFVLGILNKKNTSLKIITDILSYIPVYEFKNKSEIAIGSHVDILAKLTNIINEKDMVSIADFILHGSVTFPFTIYKPIKQLYPASLHQWDLFNSVKYTSKYYWQPIEKREYKNISEASEVLRNSLKQYITLVTDNMKNVASFISGGEDSRTVLALLPERLEKDTFIFLDCMNREGIVAKKAALSYNANFYFKKRSQLHYIKILEDCSVLAGNGSEYIHAHSFGFHNQCKLDKYEAVFGGLFSDAYLKGSHIKKIKYTGLLPFIPEIKNILYKKKITNNIFRNDIIIELNKRRKNHYKYLNSIRSNSALEWFELWPVNMNCNYANIEFNRRLFRSYEPFLSNDVIKMSASIPQKWKLNRRLFHKMAKPLLKPTRHLSHANGQMPYYSWQINTCMKFFSRLKSKYYELIKKNNYNQGPWNDWKKNMQSDLWQEKVKNYIQKDEIINEIFMKDLKLLFESNYFNTKNKVNLLQSLFIVNKYKK
ncbi:MAG: hypothetical protein ACOCRK_06390 [bacterium]